ncbi:MAG: molybdopterin-dependent oxidoreductase [Thalassobaculaceae bacterium]|nr:molybdopterin-dependent oxidoreductase [Thalassobaculaceae bacterium]
MAGPVRTTCPYCGVGCGLIVAPDDSGAVRVAGDPEHPANFGRLCSKGSALAETIGLEGRLLAPRIDGRDAGWDEALDLVAQRFSAAIAEHGPDSVAIYGSGQLLTEDYYVANKLMKGFIGSANIDTNSRLCMASSVAGHKRAFGADTVPGTYEDLEQADLVVLVGSNLAWCHPVLYQRIAAAKAARPQMRVVNIDPRRTATCDIADLYLALAPGSDVALFNGLLRMIEDVGAVDRAYVEAHVTGLEAAVAAARPATLDAVASATDLARDAVAAFYEMWVSTPRVVTVYSQGVNQSSAGTDKVNAILNCHLATGRIGRPGMGPFSVTGQPNAMGGREVGGLSNMLAAHLDLENAAHRSAVREFWRAPAMASTPGLKAVDLFRACADGHIKVLWILSTNPAVTLPDTEAVRAAISSCPFVVVSDMTAETDTARLADVLLPAAGWGEKSGTVTNSERRISRQRAFLPAPGEARADWRILCDVAARMGWGAAFDYDGPAAIFREHAALSAIAAGLGRDFDIGALSALDDAAYDDLEPVQWPIGGGGRFFADGGFYTEDGTARAVAVTPCTPVAVPTADFPLRLNTGRVRDHWHTMTRTARSARLSQHIAEPFIEIHPRDAEVRGIADADLVEIGTPQGRAVVRALLTDRVRRGDVFVPMHWTGEWAPTGRIGTVIAPVTDPISGQPELKAAVARISRFDAGWYAFVASSDEIRPDTAYWARARTRDGWRAEIAGMEMPADWEGLARSLIAIEGGEAVSVIDRARGIARVALVVEGRVRAVLFADRDPVEVARTHVINALGAEGIDGSLLAGRPGAAQPDPGATVCSCFDVGVNTILAAIVSQNLSDVEQIGRALSAGTNCGSCRPELRGLLASAGTRMAAE